MRDRLVRGTAMGGRVRAIAASTRELVEHLHRNHQTSAVVSAALGRTATMGAIMGSMLKGDERVTIQVRGDGPIGKIIVDANARGEVRGYADYPQIDLPLKPNGKLDVSGAVGKGTIYVVKDLGMKEPYSGSVPIVSGEIAEDFTYYFAKSEQIPSAVALGVLVDVDYSIRAAGGFVIQVLPGLSDDEIGNIENRLTGIRPVTEMLDSGMQPEEILKEVLPDFSLLEEMPVVHKCACSRERVEQTLISLGKEELDAMIREDHQAEVICHFCSKVYRFTREELETLQKRMN